ncbi:MAG: putative esterase/lipase [Frankiales bacterium]|nr:putative esterase/lipase [Frankiales bacterium]
MTDPVVLAGAEPIELPGGPVGVLLSHGFTGSTQSMRPWAEHLHAAGLTVVAPRLPGHGTSVKDMNTTRFSDWYATVEGAFDDLRGRCDTVFVMGLSMGGTLALRLAELRPSEVAGLVIVNSALLTERKDARLLPVLARILPSFKGIGSDIKKPGVTELAYPHIPLKAALSLQQAWPVVKADLGKITCPVLAYRSVDDHVVEASSGAALLQGVAHAEERLLLDSYHVATLDNDAPAIFEGSLEFVRAHAPAAAG